MFCKAQELVVAYLQIAFLGVIDTEVEHSITCYWEDKGCMVKASQTLMSNQITWDGVKMWILTQQGSGGGGHQRQQMLLLQQVCLPWENPGSTERWLMTCFVCA